MHRISCLRVSAQVFLPTALPLWGVLVSKHEIGASLVAQIDAMSQPHPPVTDWLQIVVLDCGRVVETGTHAHLLLQGGRYADMWERQATVDDSVHLLSARQGAGQ